MRKYGKSQKKFSKLQKKDDSKSDRLMDHTLSSQCLKAAKSPDIFNGDRGRSRCDPETLCVQTYHVIC